MASFRLTTVRRILYYCGPGWAFVRLLLRRTGQLGYNKLLFLFHPSGGDIGSLSPFSSVLQAWWILTFQRSSAETSGSWFLRLIASSSVEEDQLL